MPSATPIQYESTENSPQVIGSGLQQERQRPERGRAAEGQGGGQERLAQAGGHGASSANCALGAVRGAGGGVAIGSGAWTGTPEASKSARFTI